MLGLMEMQLSMNLLVLLFNLSHSASLHPGKLAAARFQKLIPVRLSIKINSFWPEVSFTITGNPSSKESYRCLAVTRK